MKRYSKKEDDVILKYIASEKRQQIAFEKASKDLHRGFYAVKARYQAIKSKDKKPKKNYNEIIEMNSNSLLSKFLKDLEISSVKSVHLTQTTLIIEL